MSPQILFLIGAGFFAGLVDAIAGGGGLISLPAFLAIGVPPVFALGTNKVIGIATATASTLRYRHAKLFSIRKTYPFVLLAFFLSLLGAYLTTQISPQILKPVVFGLLVLVGFFILFRSQFGLEAKPVHRRSKIALWILVPSIGFYDGFFGPGTGTFLMMAFVLLGGMPLLQASAKSRLVNFSSNLGALVFFVYSKHVLFHLALPAALASFAGGMLGAHLALTNGAKLIRPFFLIVTWGLILKIAYDLFA